LQEINFSLIVLEAMSLLKHSRICSLNQPVVNNKCKVSCLRKQVLAHAPCGCKENARVNCKLLCMVSERWTEKKYKGNIIKMAHLTILPAL
jgi:hypothetical protein